MKKIDHDNLKAGISVVAFLSSIVIGFIALFIPPQGEISPSVLWWCAQMLLFISALLGVNLTLDSLHMHGITTKKDKKEEEKEEEDVKDC